MLADELQLLKEILAPPDKAGLKTFGETAFLETVTVEAGRLSEAWRLSRLHITEEVTLHRYLNFHLEELSALADLYFCQAGGGHPAVHALLLQLIDQLTGYLKYDAGKHIVAPRIWCQDKITALEPLSQLLTTQLAGSNLSPELQGLISDFIRDIIHPGSNKIYTFTSLDYIRHFVEALSICDFSGRNIEAEINERLVALDFNHLAYFYYRQHQLILASKNETCLQKRSAYFQRARSSLFSKPAQLHMIYDPRWPSLKTMIGEWLKEELKLIEEQKLAGSAVFSPRPEPEKIFLGISVAYLACFVKAFVEEHLIPSTNLAGIFRFIAAHCSTKRQPVISPGSLSKEFYSIDQHTAARVRDILKKMVSRIDHQFFPVMAAAGIIAFFYPNN